MMSLKFVITWFGICRFGCIVHFAGNFFEFPQDIILHLRTIHKFLHRHSQNSIDLRTAETFQLGVLRKKNSPETSGVTLTYIRVEL